MYFAIRLAETFVDLFLQKPWSKWYVGPADIYVYIYSYIQEKIQVITGIIYVYFVSLLQVRRGRSSPKTAGD